MPDLQTVSQTADTAARQHEIIAFLRQPESYPQPCQSVQVIETHAALVFLAGSSAYKIKKAVQYPYLDFSTLAKRKSACERELEINQPHAPQIYLDVVPICRMKDGHLQIGGIGDPVEWAVHMCRFEHGELLAEVVERGKLERSFFDNLADAIIRYHDAAPRVVDGNGADRIAEIVNELCEAFDAAKGVIGDDQRTCFRRQSQQRLAGAAHRLNLRGQRGYVRRCHGDLHLQNVVVLNGRPVLFDAIEFDESIATIDTLYDLAFLIMDLEARHMRGEANRVLNRYISRSDDNANISGLQALPLFLACRSAIRAMVAITRMDQAQCDTTRSFASKEVSSYFALTLALLEPQVPQLICVGGLSGTGKTTIARQLAPGIGGCPGALHLRSDVERKALFRVEETHRLAASAYTRKVSDHVYARLMRKAKLALLAGSSVILDAVFLNDAQRRHARRITEATGASFTGLWLDAGEKVMIERVTRRKGDASDATAAVIRQQMARPKDKIGWHRIDADGTIDDTLHKCEQALRSAS